ncbi:histidinol-phosphatase HisJ [Cytobacillus purgationiresistens]|uniref:Histidinol-phosphatase n=1 Tax=Cytobacillus purgationiresistens TaxID=863449 RepID=A0ABU0ALJ7_9BACI|nr:histidinol-phosphatase HisJ [Cytobacillus purgationiresistens]MDQ0272117.1 histidinol-phosphatase (PHP family) [Cytobacillus purgationiresistens]
MKKDGHIHTPYCPHGSKDSLAAYVKKAVSLGFHEITFTEHAPLPTSFSDPSPTSDSAMPFSQLDKYFSEIEELKLKHQAHIKINCGLEVDFIEGYEEETKSFLNHFGPQLDEAILSVHFLKHHNTYDCLDYSPDVFGEMIERYGSIDQVYRGYFSTLLLAIESDLGIYKPKRMGHITLVKKFQKKYPPVREYHEEMDAILTAIKRKGYSLDYNGAGTIKPLCRESYPPSSIAKQAVSHGIPLVYGSDAHQVKALGQGWNEIEPLINL